MPFLKKHDNIERKGQKQVKKHTERGCEERSGSGSGAGRLQALAVHSAD